ncbi:MAG: FHA domain-containing serine/threonine-protein kinase [Planctomycetota bacterium]
MARLIRLLADGGEQEHALVKKVSYIGRKSTCEIVINDNSASRHHARIVNDANDYLILDTESRNGTYVNGQKVNQKFLSDGDHVQIGTGQFTFHLDPSDRTPTFQLTRYEILEKIGRGGMGVVFRARQKSMDRIVALKVLNERFGSDQAFVDRFIREAQAAGKLSHPNIIHVHDVSKEKGLYYFSMEYVSGPSALRLLVEKERLPFEEALGITLQVAKALDFAHTNNLIHRDIKPDNIMLTDEGEVKLADLGIARNIDEANDEVQKKTIYGTPLYMAPEQAMGRPVDHRLDLYSLGATFYHLVCGQPPFQGITAMELLKKHINEPVPDPTELVPDLPPAIATMIAVLMSKEPEQRYQSAAELVAEIEKYQRGEVSAKRLPSETTILRKLSANAAVEPSVNVVDVASDKRVQELMSLDPQRRVTILYTTLFIIGLVGLFFVIVFMAGMINPGETGPGHSMPTPGGPAGPVAAETAEALLDRALKHQADGALAEEAAALEQALTVLKAGDPRLGECTVRRELLRDYLTRPDSAAIMADHERRYREFLRLSSVAPPNDTALHEGAAACLDEVFVRLYPRRGTEARTAYDESAARLLERQRGEEQRLFAKIMAVDNSGPDGYYSVKSLATTYTEQFGDIDAGHRAAVEQKLAVAIEGLATINRIIDDQRTKELETLKSNLVNAFDQQAFAQVYALCDQQKRKYPGTLWEQKADAIFQAYHTQIGTLFEGDRGTIASDLVEKRYSKALTLLDEMARDFQSTPFAAPLAELTAATRAGVEREFNQVLQNGRDEAAQLQFPKARLAILREIHNFMGTPFKERLEARSNEYELLGGMWEYLTVRGATIDRPLSANIIKSGEPNILRGLTATGIYLQIVTNEAVPPQFIHWDTLTPAQEFDIFKTVLTATGAPARQFETLALFCRQHDLAAEEREALDLAARAAPAP